MASIALQGNINGSGSMTLAGPNTASALTLNIAPINGTLGPLVHTTAQSATGTSVEFTGIPSWVKRITVMLNGVSASATSSTYLARIGTSGTVATTGYFNIGYAISPSSVASVLQTTGFYMGTSGASAASTIFGSLVITRFSNNSNTWIAGFTGSRDDTTDVFHGTGGSVTISGDLDILSVVLTSGSFDAGEINIMYE